MNRNLDGIYFIVKRDDKWQNICFTDLTNEETNTILKDRDDSWLSSMLEVLLNVYDNVVSVVPDEEFNDIKDLLIDYKMFDSLKFSVVALQKNIKIVAYCADISAMQQGI